MRYVVILLALVAGCASSGVDAAPKPAKSAARVAATRPAAKAVAPYIVHLPGIGGPLAIDRALSAGLQMAALPQIEIFDWTAHDAGLHALTAYDRNRQQAQVLAERLTAHYRAHPEQPIIITSHSGGTGVAVWALEKCPPDVKVQTLLLMAPALSPGYDLSPALAHVTGRAYAFYSPFDNIVLGTGTSTFGTIDRVYTQAAGMVGFKQPADAKFPREYAKLVPMPYTADWLALGNRGDHIGPMSRLFAAEVLSSLLGGTPPPMGAIATTRPITTTRPVRQATSGSVSVR